LGCSRRLAGGEKTDGEQTSGNFGDHFLKLRKAFSGGILPTVFIITIFCSELARRIFANRDSFLREARFP
jgi:hypothetical protein